MLTSWFALQRVQIRPDEHAATPSSEGGKRRIMRHSGKACASRLILWSRSVCYFRHISQSCVLALIRAGPTITTLTAVSSSAEVLRLVFGEAVQFVRGQGQEGVQFPCQDTAAVKACIDHGTLTRWLRGRHVLSTIRAASINCWWPGRRCSRSRSRHSRRRLRVHRSCSRPGRACARRSTAHRRGDAALRRLHEYARDSSRQARGVPASDPVSFRVGREALDPRRDLFPFRFGPLLRRRRHRLFAHFLGDAKG